MILKINMSKVAIFIFTSNSWPFEAETLEPDKMGHCMVSLLSVLSKTNRMCRISPTVWVERFILNPVLEG